MLDYTKTGDIIEIIIRDATFKRIERHKFNVNDIKIANRVLSHIERKYGFKPEISPIEKSDIKNMEDFLDMKVDL